ncbi:MAG: DUF4412 domain-containing protein [Bacteroidales bacterium]|nr:DUF4412 domain-containing protein [Bacteroidales bacterium]MBN2756925.1 DUF4412 domain-containing protein [Bacteroidales bacterium]
MQIISHFTILAALLINSMLPINISKAQTFEGEITFVKETSIDTSYYSYKVKNNIIRIDELNKNLKLVNYMIVDINKQKIYALNPKRKIFTSLPVHPWDNNKDPDNYQVIKTQNYKTINGYLCYQWRVRNKKENTEVAFWVTNDQFSFFSDFLKIINRTEKSSTYYLKIPDTQGFFPMLSVERSLLRDFRLKLSVMKIEKKNLDISLFQIPSDYKYFQKN